MSAERRAIVAAYGNLVLALLVLVTALLEGSDTLVEQVVGVDVQSWHGVALFGFVHGVAALEAAIRRTRAAHRRARELHAAAARSRTARPE